MNEYCDKQEKKKLKGCERVLQKLGNVQINNTNHTIASNRTKPKK